MPEREIGENDRVGEKNCLAHKNSTRSTLDMKFMHKNELGNFVILKKFPKFLQKSCHGGSFFMFRGLPEAKIHLRLLKNT